MRTFAFLVAAAALSALLAGCTVEEPPAGYLERKPTARFGGTTTSAPTTATTSSTTTTTTTTATTTTTTSAGPAAGIIVVESGGTTKVSEDQTSDAFTVNLNSPPDQLVLLVITVGEADTDELSVSVDKLYFGPTNWTNPRTVTVTGLDDTSVDGDHDGTVTIAVDDAESDSAYGDVPDEIVSVEVSDNDEIGDENCETPLPPRPPTGLPGEAKQTLTPTLSSHVPSEQQEPVNGALDGVPDELELENPQEPVRCLEDDTEDPTTLVPDTAGAPPSGGTALMVGLLLSALVVVFARRVPGAA